MDFAAQANKVATMILNGEIDLETAAAYSRVARTVAQAMSTEVSRARFLQRAPMLLLNDDDIYQEDEDDDGTEEGTT
jgi:hypothetical protein